MLTPAEKKFVTDMKARLAEREAKRRELEDEREHLAKSEMQWQIEECKTWGNHNLETDADGFCQACGYIAPE